VAIISTLFEEAALVIIALFGLPRIGIHIPVAGLIAIMVVWGAVSITIYHVGSRALRRKPVISLPVISSKGKVVSPLVPEGLVRISGELWVAESSDGNLDIGTEVIVTEQDGLKLVVRRSGAGDSK